MFTSLRRAVGAATVAGITALPLLVASGTAAASGGVTITKLAPDHGPIGASLHIHGTGLTGATFTIHNVALPATAPPTDTQADVSIPSGVTSGPVVAHSGLGSANGPTFYIQQPTAATETLSHSVLTYAHPVTVSATLTLTSSGKALKGERARLERRVHGSQSWHTLSGTGVKRTSSHGVVSWQVSPSQNVGLRVKFASSRSRLGTTTAQQILGVRPALHVSLPSTLQTRQASALTGHVSPGLSGSLVLQRRVHGTWHTAGHLSSHRGAFSSSVTPTSTGKYAYRIIRHADATHRSSVSRVLTAEAIARTLSLGDSGRDVLALQASLRHLHYDVGPKSDEYGDDMLHAVTAFEKVQHLTKDGAAGASVQKRLGHPIIPHLRHPLPDAVSVEVDLHRQVLFIAKHGHIWRILDTSTAGGYYYTDSEGQTEKAVTPTGHFSIKYKENGLVHSKLGTLYRPSYFNYSGYAIHGEGNGNDGGEVPPYANSHGCVRITNLAVDRYYNLLAVGVSVWIYS